MIKSLEFPRPSEIVQGRLHRAFQDVMERRIKAPVQIHGEINVNPYAESIVFLYDHHTVNDTACLAIASKYLRRVPFNLVAPGEGFRVVAQKLNPTSHMIYTERSTPHKAQRDQLNRESIISLADRVSSVGKSSITIAPDGGTSEIGMDHTKVKTGGIQLLLEVFDQAGLGERLQFLPVGFEFSDTTYIKIGSELTEGVRYFHSQLSNHNRDLQSIRSINADFKAFIADGVNQLSLQY